jgi:hypothetical protein
MTNIAPIDSEIGEAVLQVYLDIHSYAGLRCQFCGRLFYRAKESTAPRLCLVCRSGQQ